MEKLGYYGRRYLYTRRFDMGIFGGKENKPSLEERQKRLSDLERKLALIVSQLPDIGALNKIKLTVNNKWLAPRVVQNTINSQLVNIHKLEKIRDDLLILQREFDHEKNEIEAEWDWGSIIAGAVVTTLAVAAFSALNSTSKTPKINHKSQSTNVRGYYRKDGTYVRPHTRGGNRTYLQDNRRDIFTTTHMGGHNKPLHHHLSNFFKAIFKPLKKKPKFDPYQNGFTRLEKPPSNRMELLTRHGEIITFVSTKVNDCEEVIDWIEEMLEEAAYYVADPDGYKKRRIQLLFLYWLLVFVILISSISIFNLTQSTNNKKSLQPVGHLIERIILSV